MEKVKKAYAAPKVTVHGTAEGLTMARAPHLDSSSASRDGLATGKVVCDQDAVDGIGQGAEWRCCS